MKLESKVALVTGGGSGIGRAGALALAEAGAKVAVLDHNAQRADDAVAAIHGRGGEGLALTADVSDPEQVKRSVERLIEAWGRLDILFANAGINGVWTPIDEMEPAEWDQVMNVNLRGTFLSFKYAIPHLRKRGGSAIVTSSVQGTSIFSIAGSSAYSCTKAAQLVFAKKAALELAPDGVRVNAIRPGDVATNIGESTFVRNTKSIAFPVEFPEGRSPLTGKTPIPPAEVGKLVVFLASDDSAAVTGGEFLIDAGASLVVG